MGYLEDYNRFIDSTSSLYLTTAMRSRDRAGIVMPSDGISRLRDPLPSETPCEYCNAKIRPNWNRCKNCGAAR